MRRGGRAKWRRLGVVGGERVRSLVVITIVKQCGRTGIGAEDRGCTEVRRRNVIRCGGAALMIMARTPPQRSIPWHASLAGSDVHPGGIGLSEIQQLIIANFDPCLSLLCMLWSCLIDVIMIANFDLFYLRVPRCVTSTGSLKAAKAWTKRQRHRLIKQKKATKIDLGEKQAPGST